MAAVSPKVTLVIPAFNNAAVVGDTLRSVLAQTYENVEVIVADHGSTDDTLVEIRKFEGDPRVTVLTTEPGGGAVRNWNRVSEAATGDLIKLVCADDLVYPECVSRQVAAFEPGVVMVASRRDVIDARGAIILKSRGLQGGWGRKPGCDAIRQTVRQGTNIFGEPACVMFATDALRAVDWWDDTAHYLIDEETYAKVLLRGDFVGLPTTDAAFRIASDQWSVRLARRQSAEATRFHRDFARAHPGILSRADVVIGNTRARVLALARRAAYVVLKVRMKGDPT